MSDDPKDPEDPEDGDKPLPDDPTEDDGQEQADDGEAEAGEVISLDERRQVIRDVLKGGRKDRKPPKSRTRATISLDFDPEEFNERYAVIVVGGRAVILDELHTVHNEAFYERHSWQDRYRYLTFDAFEKVHANRLLYDPEKDKNVMETRLWMASPKRRTYQGVMFEPDGAPDGYYNLFQGFAVEPSKAGSCEKFKQHILDNVCQENVNLYDKVFAWFAQIFQHPGVKTGTSLCLRGSTGCGKTVVGEHMGRLMGPHWRLVDQGRYVTGQFNSHMAQLLLLQADEGFWAGDKSAEGHLKGLVTSKCHFIEPKGVDAIPVSNYLRLLVTSNEGWVVPTMLDERRFMVLDVGNGRAKDRAYFKAIADELTDGGYERLLYELLTFDLSKVDLSDIPQTAALIHQKVRSLSPEESWWYECLWRGAITGDDWRNEIPKSDVEANYIGFCERRKVRHTKAMSYLSRYVLKKFVPELYQVRPRTTNDEDGSRPRNFVFPSLEVCREHFNTLIGGGMDWDSDVPTIKNRSKSTEESN